MLIGQLHYETTPKYSFLQSLRNVGISKRLVELSLNSMHTIKEKIFKVSNEELASFFIEHIDSEDQLPTRDGMLSALIMPLRAIRDGTSIIGIDVSSIKIGVTDVGVIYAVRGAIVLKTNNHYRYIRLGPLPFHITKENVHEVFGELSRDLSLRFNFLSYIDPQVQLCNIMEKWLRAYVSHLARRSIILWDGSLTAGTPGNPVSDLSKMLRVARENSNVVMGISKETSLKFIRWGMTDLLNGYKPPYLFEIRSSSFSHTGPLRLLGRIYVAKLAKRGCAFRLDIDKAIPRDEGIVAVEKLIGNETLYQGYPETLRLAHIYSTFTASDVIGIQRLLIKKYRLRLVAHNNMHRTLFGPYGARLGD